MEIDFQLHQRWMARSIELATNAGIAGEVPVGAIIISANGETIAEGENRRERDRDLQLMRKLWRSERQEYI